ncbi:hypothetical protein ADIS_2928 [Lunatimonas lonarensis]|uniref:Uncharacterized protein n=1 Tax=Lunatimonas lonarensis TaxID=1232681 RepID=R7ZQZ6_9BACT|nr:hypothetical protein ADIS_2928 [Lunatimonas lonarensis]
MPKPALWFLMPPFFLLSSITGGWFTLRQFKHTQPKRSGG